ncbi:MAG: hypothetical protein JNM93_04870 [Bacteriovoracaceae bacterium]|nr:hypothetical protein [Bacteriovoracaceae bacterium]
MITRQIIYKGQFDETSAAIVYGITRQIEITGEVSSKKPNEIVLNLEGDPSMIKLIQHQVERKLKNIQEKVVSKLPFKNYQGITLLS